MRQSLKQVTGLPHRMASLMDIDVADLNEEQLIGEICQNVWKFCRYYKITPQTNGGDELHVTPESQHLRWYVLDEVGARIGHSDDPNEELTIDYVEHVQDSSLRPFHLLSWQPEDFSHLPIKHTHVLSDDFFGSHRVQETLPSDTTSLVESSPSINTVYTDMGLVRKYLTDDRFRLVESPDDAEILWLYDHFKDFAKLSSGPQMQFVNQFPGEQVLTVKDLLAAIASLQAASSSIETDCLDTRLTADWYPVTFNLVYELPAFVAYFQRKQQRIDESIDEEGHLDTTNTPCNLPNCHRKQLCGSEPLTCAPLSDERNLWILKPWNLGRGMGISVTENLNQVIRLSDTLPMIASRYITDPVLFYRDDMGTSVKFDIRYIVLLRSTQPMQLYAYNVFWLRFANKSFKLRDFDDYDTHFTVMNYRPEDVLKQIHCDEFVTLFERQYPNVSWAKVQNKIHRMLTAMFTAATSYPPPRAIVPCPQSRACYAVDLMLEWSKSSAKVTDACQTMEPVVCEVNYSPDCERACRYHPQFFNHVFKCLFTETVCPDDCHVTKLA